jgi:phosphinothricin acetyltransferase
MYAINKFYFARPARQSGAMSILPRSGHVSARLCGFSRPLAAIAAAMTTARRHAAVAHLDDRLLADIGLRRDGDRLLPLQDPTLRIRDSAARDIPAIERIYAHHVLHGSASFEEVPPPAEELAARRAGVLEAGLPYLVAETDDGVLGYCYATPYRTRSAYRFTIEDSIYVADGLQRRGIGRSLLAALIARCEGGPWRQMVAVIGDSRNTPSIALHARLGFHRAGVLRSVGWKFNRWTDTVLMQRDLNGGDLVAAP